MRKLMLPSCILVFALVFAISCGGCNRSKETIHFESIRSQVLSGEYLQAIPRLEGYVATDSAGEHASRAGLFLFKAHFAVGEYAKARKWCDWTIEHHPESLEAQKCEFKIGLILIAEDKLDEAWKHFQKVSESDSPLRPEAEFFVAHLRKHIEAGPE